MSAACHGHFPGLVESHPMPAPNPYYNEPRVGMLTCKKCLQHKPAREFVYTSSSKNASRSCQSCRGEAP